MRIRHGTIRDLEELAAVEAACFPPAEAASRESLRRRLSVYPDHFWVLEEDGRIAAFVNGLVTNEELLRDEMFDDASFHDEDGDWQMIFGVDTLPRYRRRGYAARLLKEAIREAGEQGRRGLVLTCKETLVPYYARLGFVNEGVSASVHGGAVWYDMRLRL